jgi:hypothetical protein
MSGVDLLPPDKMSLESAGRTLSGHFEVNERGVSETERTYYDTFDALVHAEGLSVVHERGRLALVDCVSGSERAATTAPAPTEPMLPMHLADGPLRAALLPIVDVRALLPLVRVHSRVRVLDVPTASERRSFA